MSKSIQPVERKNIANNYDYAVECYSDSDIEEEEEEEGIGCNKCYSCVTGGSGPCVLDESKEEDEENLNKIPPREMVQYGEYCLSMEYKLALFEDYPSYTIEEIVGSYLGYNPGFPSQEEFESNNMDEDDTESYE
jgi:hypothetical protein